MVEHKHKVNNSLLAILAIFAIFFIAWITTKDNILQVNVATTASSASTNDVAGQATDAVLTQAVQDNTPISNSAMCKLIVGQTTIYDRSTLAINLESGASTYYAGYTVSVQDVNSNGCVVGINGNSDFIAVGQIQRIGALYVTVKEVLQ